MKATLTPLLALALVAIAPSPAAAQDDEVLDREFMIGPRIAGGVLLWSRDSTDPDENNPALLGIGVDMRKELGRWVIRGNIDLLLRADFSDGEVFSFDVGTDFYLIDAPTSLYAGIFLGMTLSEGPNPRHTALAIGPAFGGRLGLMFRRHRPTRFYIEAQAGYGLMNYQEGLLDEITPDSYGHTQILVATGVGF